MRAGNGIGDDEEDASPPIAFRKISRPSANRRQRKRLRLQNEDAAGTPSESSVATSSGHEDQESSENSTGTLNESASTRDSDEDQPEESVSERLERIRLLQMERSRARGCDAEELLRPVLEPSITQQKKKPVVSGLSHRTSTDESSGGSGAKYGLQASFAKETEHVPTNALMEKYIQEELKKELGAEVLGIVEQEENADVASHDTEHLLYQLPEHLQVDQAEHLAMFSYLPFCSASHTFVYVSLYVRLFVCWDPPYDRSRKRRSRIKKTSRLGLHPLAV